MCARGAQSLWIPIVPSVRSAKEALWWNCHSTRAFFSPWTRFDNKKDVVRDTKEKERERRALLCCAGWPVSFKVLVLDLVWQWKEGVLPFLRAALWFFGSCERICNALN